MTGMTDPMPRWTGCRQPDRQSGPRRRPHRARWPEDADEGLGRRRTMRKARRQTRAHRPCGARVTRCSGGRRAWGGFTSRFDVATLYPLPTGTLIQIKPARQTGSRASTTGFAPAEHPGKPRQCRGRVGTRARRLQPGVRSTSCPGQVRRCGTSPWSSEGGGVPRCRGVRHAGSGQAYAGAGRRAAVRSIPARPDVHASRSRRACPAACASSAGDGRVRAFMPEEPTLAETRPAATRTAADPADRRAVAGATAHCGIQKNTRTPRATPRPGSGA